MNVDYRLPIPHLRRPWPVVEVGRWLGQTVARLDLSRRRAPLGLSLAALGVSLAAAAPLLYVLVRASSASPEIWTRLWSSQLPALLLNTVALVVTTTCCAGALGVALAWIVERTDVPGRAAWRWILALPLAIPAYVLATCALLLLRRGGLVDQLAQAFGASAGQVPLPNLYTLGGATLIISLSVFPYVYVPVAAALRSMNRSYEEAARMAGLGAWATFRTVTWPLILPSVLGGALLVSLCALSDFGTVALLRYPTFTVAIYNQFTGHVDRSAAAVVSMGLIVLAVPLLAGETWLGARRQRAQRTAIWKPQPPRLLGRWRWPAFACVAGVALLAVGAPTLVLAGLTAQGLLFPTEVDRIWRVGGDSVWQYGLNSLLLAGAAATLASVLALAPTYLAVRFPHPVAGLLLHICRLSYALPGLIVGLGFVMLFSQLAPAIYGTVIALMLGFILRLLPYAVSAGHAALRAVPPSLEQAARVMGRRPLAAFWRITLPAAAPGLLGGWTLAFIAAMKELPTAILLRPPGFDTLAVRIWAASSESVHTQAAPPAFLLIVLTMIPLAWMYARGSFGLTRVLNEQ
ncbi:MAG: iron ABC transporter permease [Anaerolineae bacterium]|nr:iron ABC transporter permease [Thermoflexales bacterium]MDW8408394.1 iron ABC transporter permease [Anaerolineae bacterium]